jgi:sialic acid synthase SpsE
VIADPGCTHDGSWREIMDLIVAVRQSGADAIKLQWTSSAEKMCERRNAPQYRDSYELLQFPVQCHEGFKAECDRQGIEYLCTVYLPEDIPTIAPFVSRFKISSFESPDAKFFAEHLPYRKPIIVSTGMMSPAEVLWYVKHRDHGADLSLLHCVSAYPTPMSEMNLAAIWRYSLDGFSDHSRLLQAGGLAVAAGARIVETHVRPEGADPEGADYAHSFTPSELAQYVTNIRRAEEMMGTGFKRCQPSEESMRRYRVEQNNLAARHD